MDDNRTERLLFDLLQEVRLLTVSVKADALNRFEKDFLTTDMRKKAYESFDGEKTLQEISNEIGWKVNSLQVFAQQLVEKDLVNVEMKGKFKIISKSISKIAIFYAIKKLNGELNDGE